MWNKPSIESLTFDLPALYETDGTPIREKIIYAHFFLGGCDWWATEFDGKDLFFGFVCLGDPTMAEWGYFSLSELSAIKVRGAEVDFDLHWTPRPASKVGGVKVWG